VEKTQRILRGAIEEGLNQSDIARITGLSAAHVGRLLSGESANITESTRRKLKKLEIYIHEGYNTDENSTTNVLAAARRPTAERTSDDVVALTNRFLEHLEHAEERYRRLEERYDELREAFHALREEFQRLTQSPPPQQSELDN